MEMTTLSRFEFSGGRSAKLSCSCGSHKLTVGTRNGQVWLQVPCYLCDGVHFLYFTARHFWNTPGLTPILCSDTELQLGVFGRAHEVDTYTRTGGSELDRLLEDEAFGEYFDEPEVMFQALSRIHALAEEGNLTCGCGNQDIAVDIFPERLELSCSACGSHKTILAASEEDLAALEATGRLQVGDDSAGRRRGHKK
jgi:hypothetical protein